MAIRLFVLSCVLYGLSTAAAFQQQPTNYIVGPQDVLTITVFDQEDLTGKYPVDADGSFTFPLIGRVQAGGLTLRQLESQMKKQLKDGAIFKDPQLSVAVESYKSQKIHMVGEVRNPGTYPLTGDMSLIEAIARAGSTMPTASGEALIVRAKSGSQTTGPVMPNGNDTEVTTVDLKELQSGALSQNVTLKDGDTIFVPRAETIYVFGQVKNPGAYPVQRSTTVLQALSLAGGVNERGAIGRIKIVRIEKGKTVEIKAKLTDTVRPGDTIMVPERFF
ncbi:MAG: polysaccharide biosynthesis/export family protein [Cyanobacteria bacterium]|nr:polysaccharide biosynthesis/export family protein [Cyanobacteriota bacterium]